MYKSTIRLLIRSIFSHPGSFIKISFVFLLCCLPVISIGWAWGIAVQLAYAESESYKLKCMQTIRKNFSYQGLLLFLIGIMDITFVFMIFLSFNLLINTGTMPVLRVLYALFIWIDVLVLASGIYRYPLAALNPALKFEEVISKGILLMIFRLGPTLLILMVIIFILMISFVCGLFFPLFAPGSIALLCIYAFLNCTADIENENYKKGGAKFGIQNQCTYR